MEKHDMYRNSGDDVVNHGRAVAEVYQDWHRPWGSPRYETRLSRLAATVGPAGAPGAPKSMAAPWSIAKQRSVIDNLILFFNI